MSKRFKKAASNFAGTGGLPLSSVAALGELEQVLGVPGAQMFLLALGTLVGKVGPGRADAVLAEIVSSSHIWRECASL